MDPPQPHSLSRLDLLNENTVDIFLLYFFAEFVERRRFS